MKGPAAIGGRLRWHLVYLYGSGERRPAFLDRSSADGFVFLERNVASEREESGGQGETVSREVALTVVRWRRGQVRRQV